MRHCRADCVGSAGIRGPMQHYRCRGTIAPARARQCMQCNVHGAGTAGATQRLRRRTTSAEPAGNAAITVAMSSLRMQPYCGSRWHRIHFDMLLPGHRAATLCLKSDSASPAADQNGPGCSESGCKPGSARQGGSTTLEDRRYFFEGPDPMSQPGIVA